jgi:hypothetical protein
MVLLMIAGLVVWMFGCAFAGYHKRFGLFLLILVGGMSLNTDWMVFGLDAKPLSNPAIMAHAGVLLYAFAAVGFGWLAGRMVRGFRESSVKSHD